MPNREDDERRITRRSLVTSIPVVGGGSLLGSTGLSNATGSNVGGKDTVPGSVRVAVDPSEDGSEWSVDERIFGKFFEQNGRDAYPGIYSDHVSNGSFEVWNDSGPRTSLLYDVEKHAGVAYGWEPIEAGDSGTFEQPRGGVHGREAEPDLESGDEVPGNSRPDPGGVDAARFQRIRVDGGRAGVEQRTALPDRRTKTFVVDVSVRGDTDACEVRLADDHGVHDSVRIPVTDQWERHGVELAFDRECRNRYRRTPFGECSIAFQVEGEGRVDLDRVVLRAGDAVRGKYNPTTIDRLRDCNVTSLRWGGNFNSQYHWRDGVGPQEDRPVVPNGAWGGLERNYLGTNEFLEFCELVGVEPLITVGTWTHIGPEEAADWVEYVNGDRSTEMGQLRAKHGYPEPWDVRAWQVGNEVWGHYQVGHQRAKPYARRYSRYYEAMKEADPVIEIDATGIDPGYTDYSDGALLPRNFGTPPTWNPILFGNAGEDLEGVDIHRYSGGLAGDTAREKWLRKHDCDPVRYNEMLVSFPRQFGDLVDDLRTRAAQRGVEDLRVTFGE